VWRVEGFRPAVVLYQRSAHSPKFTLPAAGSTYAPRSLASSTPNRNRSASTFRRTEALLLGRRTYEIFAGSCGVWDENAEGLQGELTRRYNRIPKYVASRTLTETRALPSGVLVNTYRPSDAG
jgi:hypothetical protein